MKEIDALKIVLAMAEAWQDVKPEGAAVKEALKHSGNSFALAEKIQDKATSLVDVMISNIENGPAAYDVIQDAMREEGLYPVGIINVCGVRDEIQRLCVEDEEFAQMELSDEDIIGASPASVILKMLDTAAGKKDNEEILMQAHADIETEAAMYTIRRYIEQIAEKEDGE